jgi:serine/threonine-protein kinase
MELVDGPSLAEALAAGPLDPARCLDVVAQTASGLHEAHLAGLVHRDIKPANLLLAPGGLVKITDFGIAQAADSAPVTVTGQLLGTPGYLAPERVLGAPATSASDLYSLGIVAYACLTGGPPFTGPALAVALAHRERPLPPLPGHVPGDVAALVVELTAKDPAGRPRSAGEVARRASLLAARQGPARDTEVPPVPLAELLTQHLQSRPPPVPRHRARRALRRAGLPTAAAIVVVAAAFLIGSTIDPGLAPHAGTVPSVAPSGPFRPGATQAATVEVRPGPLIGQPVTAAVHRLRQQGLSVRIVWRRSGEQPPGTVLSVQPAGQRPVGSLVILTVARTPRRHGQRGDGDRQGDGTQQGGGDQQGGTSHGKIQGHRNNDPAGGSTVD